MPEGDRGKTPFCLLGSICPGKSTSEDGGSPTHLTTTGKPYSETIHFLFGVPKCYKIRGLGNWGLLFGEF